MDGDTQQYLTLSILDRIYDRPLDELNIPFSNSNLKKVNAISNLHSNLFQNIIFYSHNNFEIRMLVDRFGESAPAGSDPGYLNTQHIESLFLQLMSLYQVSTSLGLDFVQFSDFRLLPDRTTQLPITLTEEKDSPLKNLLKFFQKNKHFKDINEKNHQEIFNRLKNKYTFNEDQLYIYKYDDFASTILNTYPIAEMETNTRIKIKINTSNHIQKKMIKINLNNHHASGSIFFADLANPSDNLPHSINHLMALPGKPGQTDLEEDFVSIIDQFDSFLKKFSFTSLVLMIDRLRTKEDAEFINYLMEALEITNIVFICFDTTCDLIDFDLELNEKPGNLLKKYLRFAETGERKILNPEDLQLLKIFHTLPAPLPQEQLQALFSPAQSPAVDRLIKKNFLKIRSGKIYLESNLSHLNIKVTAEEEKEILESLLHKDTGVVNALCVKIKYFLVTRQIQQLKDTLKYYLQERIEFEADSPGIKGILIGNHFFLETHKDIELVELFAALLVEENELDSAKELILNDANTNESIMLKLKLAHIYKWEKDQQKMDQLLSDLEKGKKIKDRKDLSDEYHYLRFVYYEKVSDRKRADRHFKKIKGKLYKHRAAVLFSDRHLYKGEIKEVETLLNQAIDYFHEKRYPADEIEAKSHLAKLLREKHAFEEAKKLYQNLFIKSEMKSYRLLSAYIAVDLGNLYWVQDKFNSAQAWYKKALKIFQSQDNQNGMFLAKSNLMEINKITGSWQETKKDLESVLNYNKQKNAVVPLAYDYFNIGHLEYLKHRFSKAREFIEIARSLFEKNDKWNGIIECEILKLKLSFLEYGPKKMDKIDLSFFHQHRKRLTNDQQILVSIMQIAKGDHLNRKHHSIVEKLNQVKSKTLKYEIISMIINQYKTPGLMELLKSLSTALSKEDKNYYYYEYFYVYYRHFFDKKEIPEDEKERFNEVYYFFRKNQRKLDPIITRYKYLLDKKDSQYDIFKSA
ncbi:MAG: hypothetical protein JSV88_11785, partial [Candidatus Aminicenantes bacterium]